MEPITLIVLGVLGGAGACAVAFSFYIRRSTVEHAVTDVDELAVEVERIGKAVRRLTMQRVRASAADAPPEYVGPAPAEPLPPMSAKDALRRKYLGGH